MRSVDSQMRISRSTFSSTQYSNVQCVDECSKSCWLAVSLESTLVVEGTPNTTGRSGRQGNEIDDLC